MMARPDLSIITVVYNDPRLERAIASIQAQDYDGRIEHIVVDGGSTDGTVDVMREHRKQIDVLIQEPDEGIYDAMNKGVRAARGDVIAILNADDQYASPGVISSLMEPFARGAHAAYGDIVIERPDGTVARKWVAGRYARRKWRLGWMPPHPAVLVQRQVYEQAGLFRTDLSIAADYEFMLRAFYRGRTHPVYVPQTVVRMASGGASQASLAAILRGWGQTRRAWGLNGSRWGPIAATLKPLRKVMQVRK